jgi:hypothetical protein
VEWLRLGVDLKAKLFLDSIPGDASLAAVPRDGGVEVSQIFQVLNSSAQALKFIVKFANGDFLCDLLRSNHSQRPPSGERKDPSPGPLRLVKTPAASHPLPRGEG